MNVAGDQTAELIGSVVEFGEVSTQPDHMAWLVLSNLSVVHESYARLKSQNVFDGGRCLDRDRSDYRFVFHPGPCREDLQKKHHS